MNNNKYAKLHAILPRKGNKAVVFRRGPSSCVAVIGWEKIHSSSANGYGGGSIPSAVIFRRTANICSTLPPNTVMSILWKSLSTKKLLNASETVNNSAITQNISSSMNGKKSLSAKSLQKKFKKSATGVITPTAVGRRFPVRPI